MSKTRTANHVKICRQLPHQRQRLDRRQQRSQLPATTSPFASAHARAQQQVAAARAVIDVVNGGPDWAERLHARYHNPAGRTSGGLGELLARARQQS